MIQHNHHAALVHTLWRKKNENLIVKIRQVASNIIISSSTWYCFLKNQPTNKKKGEKTGEATTAVPGIRITPRTHWTTTNKLEAGPAAKGRDNEGQMRRSHVCFFGLVATCDVPGTCPTQKLPLFFNLIQMGPRKNKSRISEIPRPGYTSSKKKEKKKKHYLFAFVRVCQLSTGTYHVCHICAEIPSHS